MPWTSAKLNGGGAGHLAQLAQALGGREGAGQKS